MNRLIGLVPATLLVLPFPAAPQQEYVLWIGYQLPADAYVASDARNHVSKCINDRAVCTQACRTGVQDASCAAQCEVAFRECTLGVQGTQFWLAGCAKSRCGNGVKTLFPLTPEETVDPVLNAVLAQVQPNRFSPTGLSVDVAGGCVFRRVSDGETVRLREQADMCEAIRLLGDADMTRRTALMTAIEEESDRVVRFLLARGVSPNEPSMTKINHFRGQVTPLYAAAAASPELLTGLLKAGADPNAKSADGATALHAAVRRRNAATLLLDHGADANAIDNDGMAPLHLAVAAAVDLGSDDVVPLLIAKGADVNAKSGNGEMPLHWAALYGNYEAAEALVKAGADINARSNSGQTPLAFATEKNHIRVILYLKVAGAKL